MGALEIKKNVSNIFSDKYSNYYNSVLYNNQEMEGISHQINGRLFENINIYMLRVDDVEESVKKLKLGESDGEEGLSSEHLINGPHLITVSLTGVFNCIIVNGLSPDSMNNGTMIPIPKGK